ncbi:fumarylacetoacetate hydrolase family protein [Geminicoccaceae bacterium 1502E]|nr:fumarylacetoacetate hydrolase family protein [Geminicoccaceae bacterium 1502E]
MSDTQQASQNREFVIAPPPRAALPVVGSEGLFPVRRVYCVGRNYAEHAREMGHDPNREEPFFFQKAPDALVTDGRFPYPPMTSDVHHEIELVVALGKGGRNVAVEKANELIWGYAVGIDMTRRDLQAQAKKQGRPWEVAKSFDCSGPISPIVPASRSGLLTKGAIWLDVNGERRQDSDIDQLIWKIDESIAYLSRLFELQPGDLIFTGTPAGVAAVQRGDRLHGHVDGVGDLEVEVTG